MFQTVTRKLIMVGGTVPTLEYSRGIAMEDYNAAGFEFWVISAKAVIDLITVGLQGSNDLTNWRDFGATATTTIAPDHRALSPSANIPWKFVRLMYSVESTANARVILAAGIELSHRG